MKTTITYNKNNKKLYINHTHENRPGDKGIFFLLQKWLCSRKIADAFRFFKVTESGVCLSNLKVQAKDAQELLNKFLDIDALQNL